MGASDLFNFDKAALSQMENIRRIGQRKLRNRADLDDFVQETLLRAYSKRRQLRDTEKFDRWIAAIARNLAREWNRKKRVEPMEKPPELIDWRTPHDAVEEAERNRRLRRAMESLSPADRELLRARYMDEASYAELQAQHGLSYSAVALRIHRAKKRLRKILKSISAALILVFGGFKRAAWGGVLLMSVTTKIVVGTTAAIAAAVALWMLLSDGDAVKNELAGGDVQSPRLGDSPLKLEDQTPRVAPSTDPVEETSGVVANSSEDSVPEDENSDVPLDYSDDEVMLNEFARLVGEEWRVLIKVMPEDELIAEIAFIVGQKVMNDPQYAELSVALNKYMDRFGGDDLQLLPSYLLVRAGIKPESSLWDPIELPNGETMKLYERMRIVVKFSREGKKTEERLQEIAEVQQQEADLLARLNEAPEPDKASLQVELDNVRAKLTELQMPVYIDHERTHQRGSDDDPRLRIVEVDLGRIERKEE